MKALLDFDDAGAGDDHPAKGVTVGDIRAWFDEQERLRMALGAIKGGCFPGASTYAIGGNWKAFTEALQTIARDTLAEGRSMPSPDHAK